MTRLKLGRQLTLQTEMIGSSTGTVHNVHKNALGHDTSVAAANSSDSTAGDGESAVAGRSQTGGARRLWLALDDLALDHKYGRPSRVD